MASLEDNVKTENFDSIEVDIRLLDSFCFENIGFIKIDVEGHELHVLKGAKHLLRLQKPVLLIEMEQRHLTSGSVYDAFSFLQQIGYRVYFEKNGKIESIDSFSLETDQLRKLDTKRINIIESGYVYNFIFKYPRRNNGCLEMASQY